MGLFDKKYCDICGEKIGLLGNRKLEDGNCCKTCAGKLSHWFNERRSSTVSEIKQQLAYREENRKLAANFRITEEYGEEWRVLFDDTQHLFTVTRSKNLAEGNPDIIAYNRITGCRQDISESRSELKRSDKDGKPISYIPPRYEYEYDFYLIVTVDSPYFNEMRFRLNPYTIKVPMEAPRSTTLLRPSMNAFNPDFNADYRCYRQMADKICERIEGCRRCAAPVQAPRSEPSVCAAAPAEWTCPACSGKNSGKFCEFCGSPRP